MSDSATPQQSIATQSNLHQSIPAETAPPIIALVRDLMFSGRIMAEARAAGAQVKVVRDPQVLEDLYRLGSKLMIADLNLPGSIEAAARWRTRTEGHVVGFASHVDAESIGRARSAGIDQVLARSQFVRALPELLKSYSSR